METGTTDRAIRISSGWWSPWTALFVALVLLKATGVINWSWWLVTIPLWLPWAIALAVIGLAVFAFLVFVLVIFILELFD